MEEQREASTKQEKQEAKEDVADAKADLDKLAKELGVSPKSLRDAAEQARRQERKEELRPLLLELLDEELADDEDDDQKEAEPEKDAKRENHGSEDDTPPAPDDEGPEDSAPVKEHWSDKAVSGLFG